MHTHTDKLSTFLFCYSVTHTSTHWFHGVSLHVSHLVTAMATWHRHFRGESCGVWAKALELLDVMDQVTA